MSAKTHGSLYGYTLCTLYNAVSNHNFMAQFEVPHITRLKRVTLSYFQWQMVVYCIISQR